MPVAATPRALSRPDVFELRTPSQVFRSVVVGVVVQAHNYVALRCAPLDKGPSHQAVHGVAFACVATARAKLYPVVSEAAQGVLHDPPALAPGAT